MKHEISYVRSRQSTVSSKVDNTFANILIGIVFFFFFNDTATTEISTLPLHDALPISILDGKKVPWDRFLPIVPAGPSRYRDVSYIGDQLPVYDPAKCIACGICTASCPDSALISTVTDRPVDEATRYFKKFKNPPKGIHWDRFALNINADPAACKGCGVCAQVCPTDALTMADKTAVKDEDFLPAACRAWDNTVNLAPFVDKLSLNHQVLFVYSKLYPGKHP